MTTAPDPEKEEEESRKRRNTALGLMGAGAGLTGLSRFIITPESERRVHNLTGGYNTMARALGQNPTADMQHLTLRAYGEAGNEALGAHAFGMPARRFVEKLRSSPLVPKGDRWKGVDSAKHYDAFQQGPLYGYLQLITETSRGNNTLGSPKKTEKFLGQLMDRVNEQSEKVLGRPAVDGTPRDFTERLAWGTDPLPLAAQRQILDRMGDNRGFSGPLSPLFHNRYKRVMADTAPVALGGFKRYGQAMGAPLLQAKNIALGGGLLLAGAGAGFGIHHLLKKHRQRRAATEAKNRLASEPQIS